MSDGILKLAIVALAVIGGLSAAGVSVLALAGRQTPESLSNALFGSIVAIAGILVQRKDGGLPAPPPGGVPVVPFNPAPPHQQG